MPRRAAGDKRAYERLETEPGLDRFADDRRGVRLASCGRAVHRVLLTIHSRGDGQAIPILLFVVQS